MLNLIFKSALIFNFVLIYGCSGGYKDTHYSMYHVRVFSSVADSSSSYIKKYAETVIHFRSLQFDGEILNIFESLDSSFSRRTKVDYFEAHALLVRLKDGAEFRLGGNDKCAYLVIYEDDKTVCDQSLHVSFYNRLRNPI